MDTEQKQSLEHINQHITSVDARISDLSTRMLQVEYALDILIWLIITTIVVMLFARIAGYYNNKQDRH